MEKFSLKRKIVLLLITAVVLFSGLMGVLPEQTVAETYAAGETVYIGGMPIGVTISLHSVLIVGKGEVITSCGTQDPTSESGIEVGDILLEVAGHRVERTEDLIALMGRIGAENEVITVKIRRRELVFETTIRPALDVASNSYKLGLWVRDNTAGVGTMTYMREDGSFAALGHPITDSVTGDIIRVKDGCVYSCRIVGVTKGVRGKAGELKGMFVKNGGCIGTISDNNKYGLYGKLDSPIKNEAYSEPVVASGRKFAKVGKAQIVTTIDGGAPKAYDISIVKCCSQSKAGDRSMVLKVTDRELLAKAGGIVQGMSGSPILQDGKLIGAVTHVFINDPTRGYGLYIDWML